MIGRPRKERRIKAVISRRLKGDSFSQIGKALKISRQLAFYYWTNYSK